MSGDLESLRALETLMAEFHSPLSTNLKKKEIEKTLSEFRLNATSWRSCLFFTSHSNNHYVLMFCLHVLQVSVLKSLLTKENKCEIRNTIYGLLMSSLSSSSSSSSSSLPSSSSSSSSLPPFLRNKMVQLIVMMARFDWPVDYPGFFNEVTMLLRDEKTVLLGLTFVKLASEELMGGRDGVSMQRKSELNILFNQHIPVLFTMIDIILISMKLEAAKYTNKPCNKNILYTNNNNNNKILQHENNNIPQTNNNTTNMFHTNTTLKIHNNNTHNNTHNNLNNNNDCNNCITPDTDTILCHTLDCLCDLLSTVNQPHNSAHESENVLHNHRSLFSNVLELATSFILDTSDPSANAPHLHDSAHKHIHACTARCRSNVAWKALCCVHECLAKEVVHSKWKMEGSCVCEAVQAVLSLLWTLLLSQVASPGAAGGGGGGGADGGGGGGESALSLLDESYLRKLTDFLSLFTSKYLRHFVNHPQFHLPTFLSIISAFTFNQTDSELYVQCLEVWGVLVDGIIIRTEQSNNNNNNDDDYINKYRKPLLLAASEVMSKIHFKTNHQQLHLLDDTTLLDDLKTEWNSFLFDNLDFISKVSQLFPQEILSLLGVLFEEHCSIYFDLEKFIIVEEVSPQQIQQQQQLQQQQQQHLQQQLNFNSSRTSNKTQQYQMRLQQQQQFNTQQQLNSPHLHQPHPPHHQRTLTLPSQADWRGLHATLRDLSTTLHLHASLIHPLITHKHPPHAIIVLLERLAKVMHFSSASKLYNVQSPLHPVIHHDLVDVFAQSMAAVKVYISLLSQYRSSMVTNGDDSLKAKYDWLVESVLRSVVPLFLDTQQVPDKLLMAASQILSTLLTVVRPTNILHNSPLLQQLYNNHITTPHVNKEVEHQTYRALFYSLILPWPSVVDQEWEGRERLATSFISQLLQPYIALTAVGQLQKLASDPIYREHMKATVVRHVELMTHIISNLDHSGATSVSKKLCYSSLERATNLTLRILPLYICCPDTTCLILTFFEALIQVHRLNMGAPLVSRVVQDVIELFSKELIMASLNEEKSSGHQLIDKFLHILVTIATEPGSIFKQYLPDILKMAVHNVYPPVAHRTSPLVKSSLFHLFYSILRYNWRYFFPNSLLVAQSSLGHAPDQSATTPTCLQDSDEYFMVIMQAIGLSFMQTDLDLFRQNLSTLESLNTHFHLYHKDIFKNNLLKDFLRVLLNVLLQKSHDLHRDDVTAAIFNMATVDFDFFFSTFVPSFLESLEGVEGGDKVVLRSMLKHDRDLPSFSRNLEAFANDYWCCKMKNQP